MGIYLSVLLAKGLSSFSKSSQRRVRAVCLFSFDIINPVTNGKRAITKNSSSTLAIAKLFPAKKKSGHLWFLFWLAGSFFQWLFFSLFLESPTLKKTFCPLYLRKRFYGFGQAPLFFFPSEVSFLVIFFILLLRSTIIFLLRVHKKKGVWIRNRSFSFISSCFKKPTKLQQKFWKWHQNIEKKLYCC